MEATAATPPTAPPTGAIRTVATATATAARGGGVVGGDCVDECSEQGGHNLWKEEGYI